MNNPKTEIETLLLVDDTPDNLVVMKKVLQRALPQVEIVTFQKPAEVMGYVRSANVSAAIFDVQMPGMNGIELCQKIKSTEETRHIPVILVMSQEASTGFKAKGLAAGADDFLTRPIDNDELVARVKVALRINLTKAQLRRTADQTQAESVQLGHVLDDSLNEIFMFDAQTLRFVNVNRGARENIGYSIEELRDMTPLDIKPEINAETFAELVKPLRDRTKEKIQFETVHRRKNGTLYPIEVHLQLTSHDTPVFVEIILDITARKRAEEEKALHLQLIEAIGQAEKRFIIKTSDQEVFGGLLTDLVALTGSEFGFIGEVFFTDKEEPYLKTNAITNIAWNSATRAFYAEHAPGGMEFFNLKTLFGAVLASGEPVIANDPVLDPRRGGLPEGHPPLGAFLGVPICIGNKLVAMVGIANRQGGYDQSVIDFLQPLLSTIGQLVEARRNITARKRAEEALRVKLEELQRWQTATLGREGRVAKLKTEVNELAARLGESPPYGTLESLERKENP
jgi:PAS domain S-box-containing protein